MLSVHLLEAFEAENWSELIALCQSELKKDQSADLFYLCGVAHLQAHLLDEALYYFDSALTLEPYHPDYLRQRGHALRKKEDFEAALASYKAAYQASPSFALLKNKVMLLLQMGKYTQAEQLLHPFPDHPQKWVLLVECALAQKYYDRAEYLLKQYFLPEDVVALWLKFLCLQSKSEDVFLFAQSHFKKMTQSDWMNFLDAMVKTGHLEGLKWGLSLAESYLSPWESQLYRAEYALLSGRTQEAQALFEARVERDPIYAYQSLGQVFLQDNAFSQAQNAYQKCFLEKQKKREQGVESPFKQAHDRALYEGFIIQNGTEFGVEPLIYPEKPVKAILNAQANFQAAWETYLHQGFAVIDTLLDTDYLNWLCDYCQYSLIETLNDCLTIYVPVWVSKKPKSLRIT